MAQVRCRDASGSTGLFEIFTERWKTPAGQREPLRLERRMLTPSQRRPVLSQRRRARVRRGRVAEQDASGASGRRLESSRADGARRERVRVCPALGLGRVPRRGEGKEDLRRARHAVAPGDDRRQGEAQEHPPSGTRPSTRGPIRSFRPPPRAPRVAPRPYPSGAARAPRAKIETPPRPDAVRPSSTPSTRRRPAVDPPSRHLTSRLPRSSRAVRDDARQDPRHGGSPRRQG